MKNIKSFIINSNKILNPFKNNNIIGSLVLFLIIYDIFNIKKNFVKKMMKTKTEFLEYIR